MVMVPIVAAALLVKLAFVLYLHGRVYTDVYRALDLGQLIHQGLLTIHTGIINSKTFLGPVLWFGIYDRVGVTGLIALNFLAFVGLLVVHYHLGKGRYELPTVLTALVLLAFYVGTNRNVVAGETDDNVAALLFSVGVLAYLNTRRVLFPTALMGVGFLFKFWVAIFAAGFLVYLLATGRRRDVPVALVGLGMPFLLINCVDSGASLRALFLSLRESEGYSTLANLGFKLISTGLLLSVAVSVWTWINRRTEDDTLFLLLSSSYLVYALLNRDAFAASYVMMLCMVFASFLIAEFLRRGGYVLKSPSSGRLVVAILFGYVTVNTAITYLNLYRDTRPIVLLKDRSEAARMFPWNF